MNTPTKEQCYLDPDYVFAFIDSLTTRLAAAEAERDKAIARADGLAAEVRAWREWKRHVMRYICAEMPDPTPKIEELKRARAATDAAEWLKENVERKGEVNE